uniref:(northern house mosquito) hypothetical protein n=1 Tax=Culex pipiens TaxID=7175 RepID=A0A8D8NPM3_CULPI
MGCSTFGSSRSYFMTESLLSCFLKTGSFGSWSSSELSPKMYLFLRANRSSALGCWDLIMSDTARMVSFLAMFRKGCSGVLNSNEHVSVSGLEREGVSMALLVLLLLLLAPVRELFVLEAALRFSGTLNTDFLDRSFSSSAIGIVAARQYSSSRSSVSVGSVNPSRSSCVDANRLAVRKPTFPLPPPSFTSVRFSLLEDGEMFNSSSLSSSSIWRPIIDGRHVLFTAGLKFRVTSGSSSSTSDPRESFATSACVCIS